MNPLQSILLALVQGITEFLPISSSAHLILVPYLLGWPDQGLLFDIATNTGTLLAVIWYFRADLVPLTVAGLRSLRDRDASEPTARLAWGVALGTIPVAVCGLAFYPLISTAARSPVLIAAASIVFGLLLAVADRWPNQVRPLEGLTWRDVALIGIAQAVALIPGTSRAGITLTAGLMLGLDRRAAARFSFLLAIPVGILAAAKDTWELLSTPVSSHDLLWTAIALALSALAAYLVIGWMLRWVQRQSLTGFVVYRIALGLLILWVAWG